MVHCCLKCDQPVAVRYKRTLQWHQSWLYLLIVAGLLIYVIVAICVRQTCVVTVGLCERHAKRRQTLMLVGWAMFLSSIGLFVAAAMIDGRRMNMPDLNLGLGLAGGAFLLVSAFWAVYVGSTLVTPSSISGRRAWVRGAREPLLSGLPELPHGSR